MYSHSHITQTAATVAHLLGIDPPRTAVPANPILTETLATPTPYDRVLLYNPDAVALWLYQKYTHLFTPALRHTAVTLPVTSVMPSVTPVCFASMYTGATPDIHGIRTYTKPVLQTDTLFDAAIRAGKKCAIVSTAGDSISKIFLDRNMDYYLYPTYAEVLAKAKALIEEDQYDLLTVYNTTYDSTMHKHAPESDISLATLAQNCEDFATLVTLVKTHWQTHNTLYGFCPDHGCHEIDGNCGSHGLDMAEDMNVVHLFGSYTK